MGLLSRASRVARWSSADWRLLAEAWLALPVAWLALRRRPLPALLARLRRTTGRSTTAAPDRLARAVARAARLHPLPMLCLPQSITLGWMLARRGQPCELLIGARPGNGTLDAHAWIEIRARPINSPPDSADRYPVLLRERLGEG